MGISHPNHYKDHLAVKNRYPTAYDVRATRAWLLTANQGEKPKEGQDSQWKQLILGAFPLR